MNGKLLMICAAMAVATAAAKAQTYNPYKSIGREARVLTLSNGKYEEFFDTDTLEVIGSAILNTKTMKVIGFVVVDTLYPEASLEPELVSRWLSPDPLAAKYPQMSPYNFALNNPIIFVDPDGQDVVVAFTGGPTGGGKTIKIQDAGTTGKVVEEAQKFAHANGIEFDGTVIAPGATAASAIENALSFIEKTYTEGEKLIIYGYSYGGDFAVELSQKLKEKGITVDLLITVDASDGPLQNITVNTTIPDNVKVNENFYQTEASGQSSTSQKSGSLGSDSSIGSSDSPGSSGRANAAADPLKTTIRNYDLTGQGMTHGNIDEKVNMNVNTKIKQTLGSGTSGQLQTGH